MSDILHQLRTQTSHNIDKVLWVSKNGDDQLALAAGKYDFNKHWANPTVAMSNASPGDLVWVLGGTYTIGSSGADLIDDGLQVLCINNVTLHLSSNSTIHYLSNSTTTTYFDDQGQPGVFRITGEGTFILSKSIDSSYGISNENSVVVWNFNLLDSRVRFRWQLFDSVIFKGSIIQRERGTFSSRVSAVISGTTSKRKTLAFIGSSWNQQGASTYDQFEIAYIQNTDIVICYDNFEWRRGSGGCIRLRVLNDTNTKRIDLTSLSEQPLSEPLIYSDSDDSSGIVTINFISTPPVFGCVNSLNPTTNSISKYNFNGVFKDNVNSAAPISVSNPGNKTILIDCTISSENVFGVTPVGVVLLMNAQNTIVTGYIKSIHPDGTIIQLGLVPPLVDDSVVQGTLNNLIMKPLGANSSCVRNESEPNPLSIKVMNCYSNKPVNTSSAGGVVQLIQTVQVNTSV